MENKINIEELLKDCPKGMELDCTLLEGLEFDDIIDDEYFPIRCRVKNPNGGYNVYNFTKYGCLFDTTFAKCVIFPKGKTTWEGFVTPWQFKDGDVLTTISEGIIFIHREISNHDYGGSYVSYARYNLYPYYKWYGKYCCRLATEEEKQKLFDAIKANGYKWNDETKSLKKLVKPKFKVGDRITYKVNKTSPFTITEITDTSYKGGYRYEVLIEQQDNFELVPNKFDINTLKPFDKVLVRMCNIDIWECEIFSMCSDKYYKFHCIVSCYNQCVPYEGNEHLLGTTDDCDEYYKTWE